MSAGCAKRFGSRMVADVGCRACLCSRALLWMCSHRHSPTHPVRQEKSFREKYLQQLLVPQNPTNQTKCFPRIPPTILIVKFRRENASPATRPPPAAHPTDCLCRRILRITQAKSQPRKTDVSSVVEKREEFLQERLWIKYEHKIQPQTQTESHTY